MIPYEVRHRHSSAPRDRRDLFGCGKIRLHGPQQSDADRRKREAIELQHSHVDPMDSPAIVQAKKEQP